MIASAFQSLISSPTWGAPPPLTPRLQWGIDVIQICPLMRFALTLPLQTVICSPGRRQAARGNQEVKIPTGASPWARNYLIRTANPRLQSQTDLSGAPTSRYGTPHPSAHPRLRPEGREKDERIHGSASSDYAPGDGNMRTRPPVTMLQIFSSPAIYFEILCFFLN